MIPGSTVLEAPCDATIKESMKRGRNNWGFGTMYSAFRNGNKAVKAIRPINAPDEIIANETSALLALS